VDGNEGIVKCSINQFGQVNAYGSSVCLRLVGSARFAKETDVVVIGKGVFVEHRFGLSLNRVLG